MQTLAPTWNLGPTATAKWYVRLFPSLKDIAFLLPLFVLFARMNGTQLLFSDGDTGWHIRTGDWILAHGAVPTLDLFSFTKSDKAWFAWEWGWDVLAAVVHRYAGLAGIGFIASLMLGLFTLLLYRVALLVSQHNVMSMAATALGAAVSSIHWLARPHLVTWIFTLLFLSALESARLASSLPGSPASRSLTMLLPLLTIFWTNLHGGFVAGLILVACYAIGEALTAVCQADSSGLRDTLRATWQASAVYFKSVLLCAAATLINPYGWQLHKHIYAYLSDSELLDKIQEFQSISFHAAPAIFLEVLLLLAAFAAFDQLRMRRWTPVLLICLWAHFALQSARHIPLFAIVAAPFVAAILASGLRRAQRISVFSSVAETITDICGDLQAMELTPRLHMLSAAGLMLIAGLFALGQFPFAPVFNPEGFPVQAIPIIARYPGNRIFTSDQWGDYLVYRLYPAQRVFFDGRSDFYGNDFVQVNQRIAGAEHDWKSLLQRYAISLVLVKPETPLAAVLKLTPRARVLLDDGKVILFDTSQIYQPVSSQPQRSAGSSISTHPLYAPAARIFGKGDGAERASGSFQFLQSASRRVALATNRSNKSQKGKTS